MSKLVEKIKGYGDLLQGVRFTVVNLHPLADEEQILRKLDMTPEECLHCDLYWAYEEMMIFVSIACSPPRVPGAVYYYKEGVKEGYTFSVTTHRCPLSTTTVETILTFLSEWIAENREVLDRKEDVKGTLRITREDLGLAS